MDSLVAESELKGLIQVAHHKFSLLPAETGPAEGIKPLKHQHEPRKLERNSCLRTSL